MRAPWVNLLSKLYQALLACYPAGFRMEFGDEMLDDFQSALMERQHPGGEGVWALIWRELRYWPGSVVQVTLRARRRKMGTNNFAEESSLKRSEQLAAMIIFLLPLFSVFAINAVTLPEWTTYVLLVLFWGSILFATGLAIAKRIPRWSLPYLGFVSMVGLILIGPDRFWTWIYPSFVETFGPRSIWPLSIRVIYVGIFELIMVSAILLSALILVNLLRLVPHTRGVWQHIRADWTQLSFMLYGGLVFSIILIFDEYEYDEIWKIVAWSCLAVGAWFYLRAKGQMKRILMLISGATGAFWMIAIAKWVLVPYQKWPTGYPISPSEMSRWTETINAMVYWIMVLLMLLAPMLLNLLPKPPSLTPFKEEVSGMVENLPESA